MDLVCYLCENAEETLDHLFFACSMVKLVWQKVAEWCGVDEQVREWTVERQVVLAKSINNNRGQRLYRCMFSIVVYHIWRERNSRRMQGTKGSIM